MKKLAIFLGLVTVIAVLYFFTPVRHYLSASGVETLRQWILDKGVWAPLIFAVLYILATVFALPGSLLTISGGVLFGTALGTILNLASATVGASLAFLLSRYLGRDFVAKRLKGKVQKFDTKIEQHGFYAVLYLRLVPLFPFNALNYSLGLTKVRFRDYFLATLIGMAPGAFVYTSIGGASQYLDLSNPRAWLDYHIWGPFLLVIVLTLIPKLVQKFRKGQTDF